MLPARLSNLRGLKMWWLIHFMKTLKAGDIRKKGDQYRTWRERGSMAGAQDWSDKVIVYTSWSLVTTLIGEPILQSDLMHIEFRRP